MINKLEFKFWMSYWRMRLFGALLGVPPRVFKSPKELQKILDERKENELKVKR